MDTDLFVMLNQNKYNKLLEQVEDRVTVLVANRHEYPLWPMYDGTMDDFDQMYHGSIRRPYYMTTIFLIQTLRKMRNVN